MSSKFGANMSQTQGGAREILKFTTAVHSTDFSPLHNCLVLAVTDGGKLHLRIVPIAL